MHVTPSSYVGPSFDFLGDKSFVILDVKSSAVLIRTMVHVRTESLEELSSLGQQRRYRCTFVFSRCSLSITI